MRNSSWIKGIIAIVVAGLLALETGLAIYWANKKKHSTEKHDA